MVLYEIYNRSVPFEGELFADVAELYLSGQRPVFMHDETWQAVITERHLSLPSHHVYSETSGYRIDSDDSERKDDSGRDDKVCSSDYSDDAVMMITDLNDTSLNSSPLRKQRLEDDDDEEANIHEVKPPISSDDVNKQRRESLHGGGGGSKKREEEEALIEALISIEQESRDSFKALICEGWHQQPEQRISCRDMLMGVEKIYNDYIHKVKLLNKRK
jgi:hypothetical protein